MRETPYRVTMTCGHTFKVGERPLNGHTTYACKYGAGCGYRLNWVEYEDTRTGYVMANE